MLCNNLVAEICRQVVPKIVGKVDTTRRGVNSALPVGKFVKKGELAALLGVTPRTIDHWVRRRWIPVIAPTKRLHLFEVEEVRRAMKEQFCVGVLP